MSNNLYKFYLEYAKFLRTPSYNKKYIEPGEAMVVSDSREGAIEEVRKVLGEPGNQYYWGIEVLKFERFPFSNN